MRRRQNLYYTEEQKAAIAIELAAIIDKPTLDSETIWKISKEAFYEWRKKHDLPLILDQLKTIFKYFKDWQGDQDISDEMLLKYGISNCVESNYSATKNKVILESKTSYGTLDYVVPEVEDFHPTYYQEPQEAIRTIVKKFVGYFDWCKEKNLDEQYGRIIGNYSMGSGEEGSEITILNSLPLLKVGNITLSNSDALYNSKYFEFVNLSNLTITGENILQGLPLAFVNSIGQNIKIKNFKGAYLHFAYCNLSSVNIIGSELQQSNFFLTDLFSADITNSLLRMGVFYGKIFNVNFKETRLWDFDIKPSTKDNFLFASFYKNVKSVYGGQGDEAKAIEYFILEKETERAFYRFKTKKVDNSDIIFRHQAFTKAERASYHFKSFLSFIEYSFSYHFWGYGHRPLRVLRSALAIILLFALFYFRLGNANFHISDTKEKMDLANSLYFSIVSFTTLGYGDFYVIGGWKLLSACEALLGATCLGFLVAGYANNKY